MIISSVIPKHNHTLEITTKDGQSGVFDVNPFLESEAFAPLKEDAEFQRIYNHGYFIEWECGADLSADTIEARLKKHI